MLRYSAIIALAIILLGYRSLGQELFVYSEPASNMPKRSVGLRMTNWLMNETATSHINYHLIPEIMWGANKRTMLHVDAFLSNKEGAFALEGAGFYAKYRFYSTDKVHRHLRIAAFGRITSNNAPIHREEIATYGHNSGYQLGMVGTQLLHKTALSFTAYYEQALDNGNGHAFPATLANNDISYVASIGHLILPRHYNNYEQTNLNLMVELLGQLQPQNGKQYLDIAPSVQFIFNSQTRVDIGYRQQLYSSMVRNAPNGLLIRIEHLFYNLL